MTWQDAARPLAFACTLIMSSLDSAGARTALGPLNPADLPGWGEDDHAAALAAFRLSCGEILRDGHAFERPVRFGGSREEWIEVCTLSEGVTDARRFFEDNFTALPVADGGRPEGLFTGYYEPEVEGSRRPSEDYRVPILRRPDDLVGFDAAQEAAAGLRYGRLVDGEPVPYFTRKEIEQGALEGRRLAIVWLKDWADAFFIHIQGSGRVRLEDGGVVRLAYSLKSGLPYTAIGGILVDRGIFTKDEMSMQAIRGWMAGNEQQARELMWENQSFVFFREIEELDPSLGPPGAQGVPLTPQRSLAVDRSLWTYGTPVWIDTVMPETGGTGLKPFRQLMIAQDTGSAIKGAVRGDVFWGSGDDAARVAGHMKNPGRMVVLLPNRLARRLAGQP